MRKKEKISLAKLADDLGKPLYGTAFLSMAVMIASLVLAAVFGDPTIVNYGIAFGFVGAMVATIIAFAAFILCEIETKQTSAETPDSDNPYAAVVWM